MPVSTPVHISHCLAVILGLAPRSILDVGCGFGLWGFLCREYLDVFSERVQKDEWKVRIDGLELFEPYIQPHHRHLYDSIRIADIRDAAPGLDAYDLIIAGDVIEHLDKGDAKEVLRHLHEKANMALLVNIPLGDGWEHGIVHGNPGELHRSQWAVEDFAEYEPEVTLFSLACGGYGSFLCRKGTGAGVAGALGFEDDSDEAVDTLSAAFEAEPGNESLAVTLANELLRRKRHDDALAVLDRAGTANPGFHYAPLAAARLLFALRRTGEARARVASLLARTDVSDDIRRQAEELLR